MKLRMNKNRMFDSLFPKTEQPVYDEKAKPYDMKKLTEWEKRYEEIKFLLDGEDKQEGLTLLYELAEEGFPDARILLSDMYIEGKVLPYSFEKAVEWDRRAQYAERLFRDKI